MLALKLYVIANFLFKPLNSAGLREFEMPFGPTSALEILNQTSSHYDHFSSKAPISTTLSKTSQFPINGSQILTTKDDKRERLESDTEIELGLFTGLDQHDSNSSHQNSTGLREENSLKQFLFNSNTPLWQSSAFEMLEPASSHYDHFLPKATSNPAGLSKPSEVPINTSQNLANEDNEQDSELLEDEIDFELDINDQDDSESSSRGISQLLLAADMIQSNNIVGKVNKPKTTNPRVQQRTSKASSPRDKKRPRPDTVLLKDLRKDLESKFKTQHPKTSFSLRYYDVENWPEGVDMFKSTWNMQEIGIIRSKMVHFVFVRRKVPYDSKTEFGISDLGDLEDVIDENMCLESTTEFVLNRYREETGDLETKRINWSLLDRRDIPSRYDGCVINATSMRLSTFYKNPEIVYNIHFSPMNKSRKRNERGSREDDKITTKKPKNKRDLN